MRGVQLAGFILWRGGLMLVGGWTLYESWGWVLRDLDLPRQLDIGFGLGLTGAGFVLASLLLERIEDIKKENARR